MALVTTPAIVLSALKYSESSKIVRLATRDLGVQSAIAKGARRPRSRFGAALQVLSEGQAHLYVREHRELHTLAAFDLARVPVRIAEDLDRYAAASVLAEIMVRFAPADTHTESFDTLRDALAELEAADPELVRAVGLRAVWQLVSVLGFAPALDACVRDGSPVPPGALAFNAPEGGALCAACAGAAGGTRLAPDDRADLVRLLEPGTELPALDARHAAAHERLAARYVQWHLGEGAELPALTFWVQRPRRAG
ncbi:MAG TPA: DNA repair protein RecO [Gemmatimonadales bacterium]|nr:DNA repair protein RecO [Gemmatimonadales bacterium]